MADAPQVAEAIETIRSAYERFSEVFEGAEVEPYLEAIHPDVEWVPIMAVLEGHVYRGHDGIKQWFEDLRRDWEVFTPVVEEIHPLGGAHFLVLGHWQARARVSGIQLDGAQQASWLVRMRDGKIDRLQTFTDREEALKAAESLRSEA